MSKATRAGGPMMPRAVAFISTTSSLFPEVGSPQPTISSFCARNAISQREILLDFPACLLCRRQPRKKDYMAVEPDSKEMKDMSEIKQESSKKRRIVSER